MAAGDPEARVKLSYGWSGTFLALAGVAALTSAVAVVFFFMQRSRARAEA